MAETQTKPKAQKKGRKVLTQQEREARDLLRAAKFKELGEARVRKALNVMRQIERLGNRNAYVYTVEQADRIMSAIKGAVDRVSDSFSVGSGKEEQFTF